MKNKTCLKLFLALFCLAVPLLNITFGTASIGWTKLYEVGTYDFCIPYAVTQTADDGYAVLAFVSVGNLVHNPSVYIERQSELRLIKLDSSGNTQWTQTYGPGFQFYSTSSGTCEEYSIVVSQPYTVIQTGDGGYTIGGNSNLGLWLIKTDALGNMLWNITYGMRQDSWLPYSMIQTRDGGYAFAGSVDNLDDGGLDFNMLKLDSNGEEQWEKSYNSGVYTTLDGEVDRIDAAYSLIQTQDGGYALAGRSMYRSTNDWATDFWLVKVDSTGKEQWNKKYVEPYLPLGLHYLEDTHQVIQTSDGGYALAGSEEKSIEDNDFYLTKVDASGNVQWRQTYGDKYADIPCSLVQLNDGGFTLGGTMTEAGESGPISTDFALVRVNSEGALIWTKMYNARVKDTLKSQDFAYDMIRTTDGSYAMVGTSNTISEGRQEGYMVKTETLEEPFNPISPPKLGDVSGQLEISTPGLDSWIPATKDTSLTAGTKIRTTADNVATLTLAEVATLQLNPDTLIEIQSRTESGNSLKLVNGEIQVTANNLTEGETLDVDMSQAVATIKGTMFTTTETGTESTITVQEGIVAFTSKVNGKTVNLGEGKSVTATASGLGEIKESRSQTDDLPLYIIIAAVSVAVLSIGVAMFLAKRKTRLSKNLTHTQKNDDMKAGIHSHFSYISYGLFFIPRFINLFCGIIVCLNIKS